MPLAITNNIESLNAQNNVNRTTNSLARSLERLSSGLKVNRGADGPAALVISEQQRAQITGLQAAIENTSKGISLVQTGEGALNEINRLLLKARSLALDSANAGVNDNNSLAANQAEIANALDTIDRIANTTQFGTKKLLNGEAGYYATTTNTEIASVKATSTTKTGVYDVDVTQTAQKGAVTVAGGAGASVLDNDTNLAAAETLTITPSGGSSVQVVLSAGMTNAQVAAAVNEKSSQTGVTASLDGANGALRLATQQFGKNFTLTSSAAGGNGTTGLTATDTAAGTGPGTVTVGRNVVATITNGGDSVAGAVGTGDTITFVTGAFSGMSVQFSPAAGGLATNALTNGVVNVSNNSLVFQIGANAGQTASVAMDKSDSSSLGTGVAGVSFASLRQVNVTTTSGSQDAIKVIDQAINEITTHRGRLGAFQRNTLESTANNLRTTLENTTAAESVIRDTDFAMETATFTKNQVLLQAGTSVLQNANQIPQLVLSLLRG